MEFKKASDGSYKKVAYPSWIQKLNTKWSFLEKYKESQPWEIEHSQRKHSHISPMVVQPIPDLER